MPQTMGLEQIRTEQPAKNTMHNLVQTLSVKLDSPARYGLYREDAERDGFSDCATVFGRLAESEHEAIMQLTRCLREHIEDLES